MGIIHRLERKSCICWPKAGIIRNEILRFVQNVVRTTNKTCKWCKLGEDPMRGVAEGVMEDVARIMISGAIEDVITFRINNRAATTRWTWILE